METLSGIIVRITKKEELQKVQTEAARIATGLTKLISINSLNTESKWDSLEKRRKYHKLTLFFKMKSHPTPFYLSSLVPQNVCSVSRYNLRNADYLYTINSRTNQYFLLFLPSVVRDWNDLPVEARQIEKVNSFKNFLNRNRSYVPRHYYTGKRKQQVLHTRLRTNCSALNHDLYLKKITDSPLCRCGSIENTYHFF